VINEEPWQHLTQFAGAQCRYPSELIALVRNNSVGAIIYFSSTPATLLAESLESELTKLNCKFIQLDEQFENQELLNRLDQQLS